MKVIIAAAGTGGHINPGLAIANKIKREEPNSEIIFIGTSRGLENDLVPRTGYKLKTIEAYGLSKKLTIQNIKNMIKTYKSIKLSKNIIQEIKPDVVIGTGGYICGPVITAAHREKIPTIIHESNAFPGLATKMLFRKTNKIMVGFQEAKERLRDSQKIIITGTPTKIEKMNLSKEAKNDIKQTLGLKANQKLILVFGGSQGAKRINDTLIDLIKKNEQREYQIMWAPGPIQYEIIKQELEKEGLNINNIDNIKIVSYIYNMQEVMNVSDLVIARSGAITITEIATVGIPAIFIPLPNVSQNHQEYNAKVLKNVGAAEIILDQELTLNKLEQTINSIISDEEKLIQMGTNARKIYIPNVEDNIYKEIKDTIKK